MRALLCFSLLFSCATQEVKKEPTPVPASLSSVPSALTTALAGAELAAPASTLASAPASLPVSAPVVGSEIVATLVDGERPIFACGIMAYIGVYVYELESIDGAAVAPGQKIVVDVLCPDFLIGKVVFVKGQRHKIVLAKAQKTYASATPSAPPQSGLPRFSFKKIEAAP